MSTIAPTAAQVPPPRGPLERFLRLFADVREDEAAQLLALTLNVFLILVAYYVMKPVREVLILDQPGGAELKSYAYAAQAALLFVLVPLYGAARDARLPRRRLINVVTALFIACLPVFYLLAERERRRRAGFFLWIGVFSLMVIAQFWAYANDVYTPAAGKRLFAVIAFGASIGRGVGRVAVGPADPHHSACTRCCWLRPWCWLLSLVLFNFIDLRDSRGARPAARRMTAQREKPIGGRSAFALVRGQPLPAGHRAGDPVLNWVNSAGEYILSAIVKHAAEAEIAAGLLAPADQGRFIGAFFADYFQLVNIIGLVLQLFFVSRLVKWLGVPVALCVLAAGRAGQLRGGDAAAVARHRALGQDGRECGGLLADEHGAADAVPAHDARGEVQGQAGDRQPGRALGRRAGRRHGLRGHHGLRAGRVAVRRDQCRAGAASGLPRR